MKRIHSRVVIAAALAILAGVVEIRGLKAQQQPAAQRTILLKQDTTVTGREAIMATVDLPPGGTEGRHIHPTAEVYGFVVEGTPTLEVAGHTRTLKPGDVFTIAPGQIHEGSNKTGVPAKLFAVFFAEKGKPLAAPAP